MYLSVVCYHMLPRSWPSVAPLNPLDSAFTQSAPLTPLPSAFTQTPGGVYTPPASSFALSRTDARRAFMIEHVTNFSRSKMERFGYPHFKVVNARSGRQSAEQDGQTPWQPFSCRRSRTSKVAGNLGQNQHRDSGSPGSERAGRPSRYEGIPERRQPARADQLAVGRDLHGPRRGHPPKGRSLFRRCRRTFDSERNVLGRQFS